MSGVIKDNLKLWLNSSINKNNQLIDLSGYGNKAILTGVNNWEDGLLFDENTVLEVQLEEYIDIEKDITIELYFKKEHYIHIQIIIDRVNKELIVYQNTNLKIIKDCTLEELNKYNEYINTILNVSGLEIHFYGLRIYDRKLSYKELLDNYNSKLYLRSKKIWTSDDYYNYQDLNRVDINILTINTILKQYRKNVVLDNINIERKLGHIVTLKELISIENNLDRMMKSVNLIYNKRNWNYKQGSFSSIDANRYEETLDTIINNLRDYNLYCGTFYANKEVYV